MSDREPASAGAALRNAWEDLRGWLEIRKAYPAGISPQEVLDKMEELELRKL